MLTIKCAKCKAKTMKYNKIGTGNVLKCFTSRIKRYYNGKINVDYLVCGKCGNRLGKLEDGYFKMNQTAFTYTGTKIK